MISYIWVNISVEGWKWKVSRVSLYMIIQGRSQKFIFFIIRGANYANLYKNLIKIQIFNVNLGTIGGPGPCPPPVSAPVTIYIDFKCTVCTRRPPGWWLLVCKVPTLLVVPTFPKMFVGTLQQGYPLLLQQGRACVVIRNYSQRTE